MKRASLSAASAESRGWRAARGVAARSGPRPGTARVDAGEIFIESLVAAAVVATIMMGMFRVVTDAAAHARMTEQRRVALLVAKSELAEVGSVIPIASGDNSGVSGGMAWTISVSPYSDDSGASTVGALYAVDVTVRPRVGRGTLVRLRTLRLGPEA